MSFNVEMNRVRVAPFSPRKGGLIAPVKRRRAHQCLRFDLDHDLACESRHWYLSVVEGIRQGRPPMSECTKTEIWDLAAGTFIAVSVVGGMAFIIASAIQ